MTRRTMGLGATPGGGLAGVAQDQGREAMQLLGDAANAEQARDLGNRQMEAQRKQGNQALGSAALGMAGFAVGGPVGAAAGALIGAVIGGAF